MRSGKKSLADGLLSKAVVVPDLEEVVNVWDGEWNKRQIAMARRELMRRGPKAAGANYEPPYIVRLITTLRITAPIFLFVFALAGCQVWGAYTRCNPVSYSMIGQKKCIVPTWAQPSEWQDGIVGNDDFAEADSGLVGTPLPTSQWDVVGVVTVTPGSPGGVGVVVVPVQPLEAATPWPTPTVDIGEAHRVPLFPTVPASGSFLP